MRMVVVKVSCDSNTKGGDGGDAVVSTIARRREAVVRWFYALLFVSVEGVLKSS